MRMLITALTVGALLGLPPATMADPAEHCAKVGNDDTVRPYERRLRPEFVRAYKRLFPNSRGVPSDTMLAADGSFRCMDGKLLACFAGANLPCTKIVASRKNPGADAFCKDDPNANIVPMVATGHDTAYAYRCRDGRAEVTEEILKLDTRGFGKELWTPLE